jgi:hypothetical protein
MVFEIIILIRTKNRTIYWLILPFQTTFNKYSIFDIEIDDL